MMATRLARFLGVVAAVVLLAGCTETRLPTVAPGDGAGKPVLAGVEDVTQIAQLTGPGAMNDTLSVGVAGTDLGSMVNLGDRTYFLFGDTFGERAPDAYGGEGGMWRSNVAAWTTDDDPADGIAFDGWAPVDGIGLAAAMVEGDHDGNDAGGEVTKIPTYGFAVGETLYVAFMSVSHWGAAGQWDANYAGLARSGDEGETWSVVDGVQWPGDSNFVQVAAATVQDGGEPYVYLWGIPAGRFGEVALARVPARTDAVEDLAAYEYFAGVDDAGSPRWSSDLDDARIVLEGTIGELSVMWSDYLDRWIMTYSDAGNAYIREAAVPWGPWGEPIELVAGADYPGLYSPYLNPRYVGDGGWTIYFTLSQWGPYNVFWFSARLQRAE